MLLTRLLPHLLFALIVGLAGCDRPEPQRGVSTTTTRPAQPEPAPDLPPATASATRPAKSSLLIGDRFVEFPRARLVLQQAEPHVSLLLFSDDPEETIRATYEGNRYFLEIDLEIDDPEQLTAGHTAAEWSYRAVSMERVDSPNGIFLDGDRRHLQPYSVNIVLNPGPGGQIAISLTGQFLLFQMRDEATPPQLARVEGILTTELEPRPRPRRAVPLR